MRSSALEAWTLHIVDRVARGAHTEDSRVELKREWPKPQAAARILAGHANAARGEPILWLIGLDEVHGATGAQPKELADWYSSVRSNFDGIAPSVIDLNVPVGDVTLVALLFQTDRAPYVVKNPAFGTTNAGPVEREVPWREGRKTITARREHLVSVLSPHSLLPDLEVLNSGVYVRIEKSVERQEVPVWRLFGSVYLVPKSDARIVLPRHRTTVLVQQGNRPLGTWPQIRLHPPASFGMSAGKISTRVDSQTITATSSEALVSGPGRLDFEASATVPLDGVQVDAPIQVHIALHVVGATVPLSLDITLLPIPPDSDQKVCWHLQSATY